MPRGRSSSSSSRGSGFGGSRSASRSQSPPKMQQTPTQQVPQQRTGGMMSGMGSTLMQGMAFGAGSEVAHQAVRSMMGGSGHSNQPQQQNEQPQQYEQPQQSSYTQQNPCIDYNQKFVDCLQKEGNEISSCQNLFNDLKSCEKSFFR